MACRRWRVRRRTSLQYMARSATKASPPTLSRNTAKRRPCSRAYFGSLTDRRSPPARCWRACWPAPSTVVVTPVPSSVANVARTWMATALGLTSRKKLSKLTPDRVLALPALPRTPICDSGCAMPATTCPSFHGNVGRRRVGRRWRAPVHRRARRRSGSSLSRRTENARRREQRRAGAVRLLSVQMLKRLRGSTV